MALEAKTQEDKKVNNKDFNSLSFRYQRSGGPDNGLLSLAKDVVKLPEYREDLPTSGIRKFINRAFRLVTGNADEADIEFFERYLQSAKSRICSGEQS